MSELAFGALAPSRFEERMRALGARLPANYLGRKAASALLRLAGGASGRAFDVTVFGSQKARLHPYDNICEKRVYLAPQQWDGDERRLLSKAIAGFAGRELRFVDAGANVGLYTLFVRAEALRAGARLRAVAIEPDDAMRARFAFNVAASGAGGEVRLFACALSDAEGVLPFAVDRQSRGQSRLSDAGATLVTVRPLSAIVAEAGLDRIDILKIDIEGHERAALEAFFKTALRTLWPRLILLEISHEARNDSASRLCEGVGYRRRFATSLNGIYCLDDARGSSS